MRRRCPGGNKVIIDQRTGIVSADDHRLDFEPLNHLEERVVYVRLDGWGLPLPSRRSLGIHSPEDRGST